MGALDILKHVSSRVNDVEVLADSQRAQEQLQYASMASRLPTQHPPHRFKTTRRDRGERWPEASMRPVGVDFDQSADYQDYEDSQSWDRYDPYDWVEQDQMEILAVAKGGKSGKGAVECWNCAQLGHLSRDCPTRRCEFCGEMGHGSPACQKPGAAEWVPPRRNGKGKGKGKGGKGPGSGKASDGRGRGGGPTSWLPTPPPGRTGYQDPRMGPSSSTPAAAGPSAGSPSETH
jgi:hypothetical protein